jgi:hypothetical protein
MDNVDKALEALKFHIKKEIVDNYFGDRVYLEEEVTLLKEEAEDYRRDFDQLGRRFFTFYHALGSESACVAVQELLGLEEKPFYGEFQKLKPGVCQEFLRPYRCWGLTANRRYCSLALDVYEDLHREIQKLREQYDKIITHLRLLNEDIDKFNLSYDFGLIAAQIEALEGRQEVISGGLLGTEREELSTRMRFKRQKLGPEELPPVPALPPLKEIKGRMKELLSRVCPL